MLFDSHSHTVFSADSEMPAEEALRAAQAKGLGLVFTEHCDYDYPAPGEETFLFDPEAYWAAYEPLRGAGLSLGVEMGMMESAREKNAAFAARVPFDFIIASIHFLRVKDLYHSEAYEGRRKEEMYREYFSVMRAEIYAHPYVDALAHIDYIARNAPFENPEISYGDFAEEIDGVLRALVETETVVEINTRRFGKARGIKELAPVYRRYRELGGRYVTIGSDAHVPGAVGAHFDRALELARAFDLRVVTFRARKMRICAL
ncbi:histidinol-phosphatase HisJ family protein [Selenomonas sp. F0473]|uniref:histidinol-phosphatase HisJ family protein n=1 Tax=Selenomonas sp. F0473 TaxID=999423 RepID=UPI0025E9FA4D|nr:histidinol-phosphatase HisJ family protein [Selenomonas sp. F0473]